MRTLLKVTFMNVVDVVCLLFQRRRRLIVRVSMDSQVCGDGRLLWMVEDSWREDRLPADDVHVPAAELPDPEADTADAHLSVREQEERWPDLALGTLH